MKSIKSKIVIVLLSFVVVLSVGFGTIGSYLNYKTAQGVLSESLEETAECAAAQVEAEIKAVKSVAFETGSIARLANSEIPANQKKIIIDQRASTHGFGRGDILDVSGKSIFNGADLSHRECIKGALGGEASISNMVVNNDTGKLTFLSAAPLWENGIPNTKVIGVVYYELPEDFLTRVVKEIKIGKSGAAYIINKDGLNVADVSEEFVGVENLIEESKTNPDIKNIAEIESKMIKGEKGAEKCKFDGKSIYLGYAPIQNSRGLSIGIKAIEKEFLGSFYESIYLTFILTVVTVLVGVFVAIKFGNKIGSPIKKCADRLELLSNGDLHSDVPIIKTKDETAILASATEALKLILESVVGEISEHLTEMANGNFDLENLKEYELDFKPLSTSTNKIIHSLNEALSQINMSSDQVSSGSDQVSSGAQALSQGATEQAASIEELSATLSNIYENVKRNASNAMEANKISVSSKNILVTGNDEMKKMLAAMQDISESSNKIGNIIKTIDDIAFQTNILALNAAVEAARAGAAGKGFAVVADEVRNLASKSAEAAKDTTVLIEGAISAVEKGKAFADSTAKTLISVMEQSQKSANLVNEIADASGEQANAISQINEGVEQISAVVQTNSATAEESAAASEELNGQAQMLKDLVSKFNLKNKKNSIQKAQKYDIKSPKKELDYSYNTGDKY